MSRSAPAKQTPDRSRVPLPYARQGRQVGRRSTYNIELLRGALFCIYGRSFFEIQEDAVDVIIGAFEAIHKGKHFLNALRGDITDLLVFVAVDVEADCGRTLEIVDLRNDRAVIIGRILEIHVTEDALTALMPGFARLERDARNAVFANIKGRIGGGDL